MASRKQKIGGSIGAAIALILAALAANEGGYVNHPSDPGGETNHGVTKTVARAEGYRGPMVALDKLRAQEIYVRAYMERPGYMPIIERDVRVGLEIVDTGVNAGTNRASRWFQECLNHFNQRGRAYPDITEDADIGPATIRAFDALRRVRGNELAGELMVKCQDVKQGQHYIRLFGRNRKFEDFAAGWFRTRIGNVDLGKD